MQPDPLSDILTVFATRASVSGGLSAGGDWSIRFPPPEAVKFGAVLSGHCWHQLEGSDEAPVWLSAGDVFVVNGRHAIRLYTDPALSPVAATQAFADAAGNRAVLGQGNDFRLLGGHIALQPVGAALLAELLPAMIHLPAASPAATDLVWLLERLVTEMASNRPGSAAIAQPLAHLLFVQVLRDHLEKDAVPIGWLKAVGDARLAPAISLMHVQPARNWHLDELAQAAAMSRSHFADYFRSVAGMAPLAYLRHWRMRLAENALHDGVRSLASLAASLGYSSESAFSTAFKRVVGVSPAQYRAQARASER